jgi:hypothetical protein
MRPPMRDITSAPQHWMPPVLVAAALLVAAGSAVGQSCSFTNPPPGGILFSPALDPSIASTRTATTDLRVLCIFASPAWSFSGSNGSAPLRMKHATLSAFIPYTVSPTYVSGTFPQRWSVTATVLGTAYQNAPVGSYSDVLTVTVLP